MGRDAHICLPKAFSEVLNIPIKNIFDFIGHDGTDIIWPDKPEPYCRRGFHPQEMLDVCWLLCSRPAVLIEANPRQISLNDTANIYDTKIRNKQKRIQEYMDIGDGVAGGITHHGHYHAVSWIKGSWSQLPLKEIQVYICVLAESQSAL